MPKPPCVAAIQQAVGEGNITDAAAEKILSDMDRIIKERMAYKRTRGHASMAEEMRNIAGELDARNASSHAVARRNLLLNERIARDKAAGMIVAESGAGRSMENQLLSSESKKAADVGQAGGTFGNIVMQAGMWTSRLGTELRKLGDDVADLFYSATKPLDFLKEWQALTSEGGVPGHTGNKAAAKVAKAVNDLNSFLNAELAAHGAIIVEREGFMGSQSWSQERIINLGREGAFGFLKKSNQELAFKRFKEIEEPLWDFEQMTDGGIDDRDQLMRDIFNAFWEGKHRYGPDPSPARGSALQNRYARERVVIYKSPEAYHAHEKALGRFGENYAAGVIKMIENKARTLALLQDWGPGGRETVAEAIAIAQQELKNMPDGTPAKVKGLEQLNRTRFAEDTQAMYDMVSGVTELPDSHVVAMVGNAARTAALTTTGGAMLVNSLGDIPMGVNQMTYAGASTADALGTRLKFLLQSGKVSAEALHDIGLGSSLYLAETQATFRDLTWNDRFRSISQKFYNGIGITRLTEGTRLSAAVRITNDFAKASHLPFDQLNPDMQRIAAAHGIEPPEWDVMRKAVHTIESGPLEGYQVLSHEKFYQLPDEDIASLVRLDGNDATNVGNIRRKRAMLERKYGGMVNERVAAAASEPGGWEQWIRTGGSHAGSVGGEVRRSAFMYKGFLMSVMRRQVAQHANVGTGRFAKRSVVTMAGLIAAGYTSLVINNLLRGKEPPKFIKDDGSFDAKTLAASVEKSGGLGLYGSILLGEYDKFGMSLADSVAGPVFGKAGDALSLAKSFIPSDKESDAVWGNRARLIERNIPFANVFYIKPVLDHAIWWNLNEMLQPGTLHRLEGSAKSKGQPYFIRPTQVAGEPSMENLIFGAPKRAAESLKVYPEGAKAVAENFEKQIESRNR